MNKVNFIEGDLGDQAAFDFFVRRNRDIVGA